MKKILCVILAGILVFGLCGCLNITISKDSNTSSGSQQSSSGGSSSASQYADMSGYTIICVSSDGNAPVEGVNIQFCSNSKCMVGTTNADGISNFDVPDGEYDVHIQSVPDGFDMPSEAEFKMTPDSKQHQVVIPGGEFSSDSEETGSNSAPASNINLSHTEVVPSVNIGTITGETFDLYGNPVNYQQLFGAADFTHLNLFSEGCPPCFEEMPILTELNKLLSQYRGQVVLILHIPDEVDGNNYSEYQDYCQRVAAALQEHGAEGMQVVILNPAALEVLNGTFQGWPTNYIVDSQGNVIACDNESPADRTVQGYSEWISQHLR